MTGPAATKDPTEEHSVYEDDIGEDMDERLSPMRQAAGTEKAETNQKDEPAGPYEGE